MKNDLRITYPLYQLVSILFLMVFTFVIGRSNTVDSFNSNGFEYRFEMGQNGAVILMTTFLLFIIFIVFFSWRVARHNRQNPKRKISIWTWKPQEYIDDDELFQELTKRATKKVYTYYVWAVPLLAGILLGSPFGKTGMLQGVLLLAVGQYLTYYLTFKRNLREVD